jgi:pimeloyl-ACP methyl ester carboxylesterase
MTEPSSAIVVSADGTEIGYRTVGSGPDLVLVHGAMMTSQNLLGLARELAADFTVHLPDRRGRGASGGGEGARHGLDAEVEDLTALLRQTGARRVFGLSSGAVISLATALESPAIEALALYEPPLSFGDPGPTAWGARFERELAAGKLGSAFATIIKGTGDHGGITRLPHPLLALMMRAALRAGLQPDKDGVPPGLLLPTVPYDLQVVADAEGDLPERLGELRCQVLLVGGSRSADFLARALDHLQARLPSSSRVVLGGVGHIAADTSEQPDLVADPLLEFFGAS